MVVVHSTKLFKKEEVDLMFESLCLVTRMLISGTL